MTIRVMDQMMRKYRIDSLLSTSNNRSEFINIQGRQTSCKILQIPIDLPIYRMANGRTTVIQIEYLYNHSQLPADFFTSGEEDETVQNVQHELLFKMARNPSFNIYSELEHVRRQTEPLIITAYGVVVNGNRRLAAMRELYKEDAGSYSSFSYVDAIVLPVEASEDDIELIEVEEQLIPETKQPYGWVERLLKIYKHNSSMSVGKHRLVEIYRLGNEDKLNEQLALLSLVDRYLEEYLGRPGEYHLVAKSEQIFNDWLKARKRQLPQEKELAQLIAYPVIKESRDLGSRAYDYNAAFGRYATRIIDALAQSELLEDVIEAVGEDSADYFTTDDDPFAGFLTTDTPSTAAAMDPRRLERVKTFLIDPDKSTEAAQRIKDAFSSISELEKQAKEGSEALNILEQAAKLLLSVNLSGSDPDTFPRMRLVARTVEQQIHRIQRSLTSENNSVSNDN